MKSAGRLNTLACLVLFTTSLALCLILNSFVPRPYMDEIFHVNQTREYCDGNYWRWNDKITTPPGLYFTAVLLLKPFTSIWSTDIICQTAILRCLNVFFLAFLFWTVRSLLDFHNDRRPTLEKTLTALNICLFPVLHFFSTLFYTDILSTLAVLQMYLATLTHRQFTVALWAMLAVSIRQTNVVWVGFAAGITVFRQIGAEIRLRQLKRADKIDKTDPTVGEILHFVSQLRWNERFNCLTNLIKVAWPNAIVILAFFSAALVNGGMALGDKSAHQVVLHLPQLLYFCLFTSAFGSPILCRMSTVKSFLIWIRHCNKFRLIAAGVLLAVPIHFLTYDHPYLLADNRHFFFYIWQRFFRRYAAFKFALIPAYIAAFVVLNLALSRPFFDTWRILFWLCTAAVTVPNRLIEPRYFLIPTLFWRLTLPISTIRQLRLELLLFVSISTVVWLLFLFKPFRWPHEPNEWQRFIW